MAVLLPLIVITLVALGVAAARRPTEPHRDAAWLAGTWDVPPQELDVYVHYLARLRAHRAAGGWAGVVFAGIVGIIYSNTLGFGIVAGGPLGDMLFCGMAGVLLGAMSAELYRLRLPRVTGDVTASLAPRPVLPGARLLVAARLLAGLAVVGGAALALTGGGLTWVLAAGLGAMLVVLCEVTRTAVAHRRRAALSPRALVVDANLRTFAAGTLAWLELAAATLAATWVASGLIPDGTGELTVALAAFIAALLVYGGLIASIVFLVKASPRPPRRFPWPDRALAGVVPTA